MHLAAHSTAMLFLRVIAAVRSPAGGGRQARVMGYVVREVLPMMSPPEQ